MPQGICQLNKYVIATWEDPKLKHTFEAGFSEGQFYVFISNREADKVVFDRSFNIKAKRFIREKESAEKT